MDFNILKADFIKYLEKNSDKISEQNSSFNDDGSIFNEDSDTDFENISATSLLYEYKDEFSDYLKDEYNFDWSNSTRSLEKLLDYEVYNGKIVNPNDLTVEERRELTQSKRAQAKQAQEAEDASIETEDNADAPLIEEVPDTNAPLNPDGTQPTTLNVTKEGLSNWSKENNVKMVDLEFMTDALNDLLKNDDFKNIIKDEDGNITQESFEKFLNVVKGYDEKGNNLSLQDLMLATEDIKEGTFRYLTDEEIENTITENGQKDTPLSNSNGLSSPSSKVSASSIGSPKTLPTRDDSGKLLTENMTVEQLEAQKVETTAKHEENNQALQEAIADEQGQEIKENMDNAFSDFEQAVKEVDSDLAEKLAAQQQVISDIDNQISENENAITENDNVIATQTQNVNAADATISSLNSALSMINSAINTTTDSQAKSEYQSQVSAIQEQIEAAQQQKEEAQQALDEANAQKEVLSAKQEELQASLAQAMEDMSAIEEEIKSLETDNPQITQARENYDQQKELYFEYTSTTKPQIIQQARDAFNETQEELTQINKALDEAKANQEALELTPNGSIVEFAKNFIGKSETEVEQALGNVNLPDGLWCSAFVRQMMLGTYGEENLPDWYNNCNTNSCGEVYSAANQNGCTFTDASQAQPGDVIFFNTSRGSCKHTGIVTSVDADGTIHTIEGNSSSKVSERTYSPDGNRIFGFARIS